MVHVTEPFSRETACNRSAPTITRLAIDDASRIEQAVAGLRVPGGLAREQIQAVELVGLHGRDEHSSVGDGDGGIRPPFAELPNRGRVDTETGAAGGHRMRILVAPQQGTRRDIHGDDCAGGCRTNQDAVGKRRRGTGGSTRGVVGDFSLIDVGQLLGPLQLTAGGIENHEPNLTVDLSQDIQLPQQGQWWTEKESARQLGFVGAVLVPHDPSQLALRAEIQGHELVRFARSFRTLPSKGKHARRHLLQIGRQSPQQEDLLPVAAHLPIGRVVPDALVQLHRVRVGQTTIGAELIVLQRIFVRVLEPREIPRCVCPNPCRPPPAAGACAR